MTEKAKLELVTPTPGDALDIESLWLDPALGDGLTDTSWQTIPVEKPRDFFRVHSDIAFRRRTEIYVHKVEGEIETSYYIMGPKMQKQLAEARPCVLVTCIYRDGSPRLWPIMFPRDGEKDNTAWSSARSAARTAIDKWTRLVWSKRSYLTRDALPGYAPDPDWKKLPPFRAPAGRRQGVIDVIKQSMPASVYSALDSFLLSAFGMAWTIHKMAAIEVSNPNFVWITTNTKGTQVPSPWVKILNQQAQILASLGDRLGLDPKSRAALKLPSARQQKSRFEGLIGQSGLYRPLSN